MIRLLDNTAYRSTVTNQWQAEFVAAVFDKDTGLEVSSVVASKRTYPVLNDILC